MNELYDEAVDRKELELPDYYLPSATRVVIAGESILGDIGYVPSNRNAAGWKRDSFCFYKQLDSEAAQPPRAALPANSLLGSG